MYELHPPEEHQLLVFWVALLTVLVVARLLGGLARRVGQPAVIGELAAGLVLGPSVLGDLAPDVFEWLFPPDDVQTGMLFTVGSIGVVLLLVVTGEETDLGLIGRLGKKVWIVSAGSFLVPMAAGLALGYLMPAVFLGANDDRTVFALFFAAALSISSLPVIAKILGEMGFMRRDFGQMTLAAGMANDIVGWILLGIVAGLAQSGTIDPGAVGATVIGLTVFFLVAFTIGQRVLDEVLTRIRLTDGPMASATGVVVLLTLTAGAATQWLGVEAVLGAFVAGMLLGRSRLRDRRIIQPIESLSATFFAPVFFATAGLRVDLGLLGDTEVLTWAVAVLAVATLSKFVGSVLGGWFSGMSPREGAALGVGLNARGALQIVVATVGISLGVLNQASFTLVVIMSIGTSMMAPPMLRQVLSGWSGTPEERERLEREEALAANLLVRADPVMVPTRGGFNSVMAAQIVALTWPRSVPVTLAVTAADAEDVDLRVLRSVLHEHPVEDRRLAADKGVDALVDELRLGYGAVVVGTNHRDEDGALLSPFVDELARRSPVPVVIVRRGRDVVGRQPPAYEQVLVPVAGTRSASAGQELGLNISASIGTRVVLAHVVDRRPEDGRARTERLGALGRLRGRAGDSVIIGERLLDDALGRAAELRARGVPAVAESESTAAGILELVERHGTDLVVIGATRRDVEGRLFLGHTVERVLEDCDATIIVVVMPGGSNGS